MIIQIKRKEELNMKNIKRIVSGILGLTLLSTCMGISVYADDSKTIDDINNSIKVDTVGSNGLGIAGSGYDITVYVNNIGDSEGSITEFTVGDSVYPRGDINLDGKTNTADLLYLKKYLLGLIEW